MEVVLGGKVTCESVSRLILESVSPNMLTGASTRGLSEWAMSLLGTAPDDVDCR